MSDLVDTNYPADPMCPTCSGTTKVATRPDGPVQTCLRCGTQFVVSGSDVYETGVATADHINEVRRGSY